MSSNVYEDPNVTTGVRYSKGSRGDGGERVERLVDIYESADNFSNRDVHVSTQDEGAGGEKHHPAGQRNPFKCAALVLGPLCLLLAVGVAVLSKLYFSNILEKNQLQTSYEKLQRSYASFSNSYCNFKGEDGRTQENVTRWRRFQCSCYFKSAERKSWTDSKADCETRGAHLATIDSKEEQEFLHVLNEHEASWVGLHSAGDEWKKEMEWKWVKDSTQTYLGWAAGVNPTSVKGSAGFIDERGLLNHSSSGPKHWICEKKMD